MQENPGTAELSHTANAPARVTSHRDLVVWQKAMDLAELVYRLSRAFPREEAYRLTSQLTAAASSVPANIAEGHARGSRREFSHFLSIAKGSLMEAETFLLLALRLKYLDRAVSQKAFDLVVEVSKMLTVLRKRLLTSPRSAP